MLTSYEYSELWICLNCRNIGALSEHGRCTTCDSDSVAVADTGQTVAGNEVRELERMFHAWDTLSPQEEVSHRAGARSFFPALRERRTRGHRRTNRYG